MVQDRKIGKNLSCLENRSSKLSIKIVIWEFILKTHYFSKLILGTFIYLVRYFKQNFKYEEYFASFLYYK